MPRRTSSIRWDRNDETLHPGSRLNERADRRQSQFRDVTSNIGATMKRNGVCVCVCGRKRSRKRESVGVHVYTCGYVWVRCCPCSTTTCLIPAGARFANGMARWFGVAGDNEDARYRHYQYQQHKIRQQQHNQRRGQAGLRGELGQGNLDVSETHRPSRRQTVRQLDSQARRVD